MPAMKPMVPATEPVVEPTIPSTELAAEPSHIAVSKAVSKG